MVASRLAGVVLRVLLALMVVGGLAAGAFGVALALDDLGDGSERLDGLVFQAGLAIGLSGVVIALASAVALVMWRRQPWLAHGLAALAGFTVFIVAGLAGSKGFSEYGAPAFVVAFVEVLLVAGSLPTLLQSSVSPRWGTPRAEEDR